MEVRDKILDVAEAQLNRSPDRDIAVRAVCETVGVGAPMIYRLFTDKNGLLEAVVNRGFERYLSTKRDAQVSNDPVQDLRSGWDTHVTFAGESPTIYRLLYSPGFAQVPEAAAEAMQLLRAVLERCALRGRLLLPVDIAAQAVMSANIGVALSIITQPASYTDPDLSRRVRDAVHAAVLTPVITGGDLSCPSAGAGSTDDGRELQRNAVSIAAQLRATQIEVLTPQETALLQQWLERLSNQRQASAPSPEPPGDEQ